MIVTIRADVHRAEKKVILASNQPGLLPPLTFRVKHDDTVQWEVQGDLGGLRLQVRIDRFPVTGQRRRLFKEGTEATLPATAAVVVGTVDLLAHEGDYSYEVALVGGPEPIVLTCFWASESGQTQQVDMGGGVKTDPPPE